MKLKKVGSNRHGDIIAVFADNGRKVGTIEKWHGLFIAKDWRGEHLRTEPFIRRKNAAHDLEQHFNEWLELEANK